MLFRKQKQNVQLPDDLSGALNGVVGGDVDVKEYRKQTKEECNQTVACAKTARKAKNKRAIGMHKAAVVAKKYQAEADAIEGVQPSQGGEEQPQEGVEQATTSSGFPWKTTMAVGLVAAAAVYFSNDSDQLNIKEQFSDIVNSSSTPSAPSVSKPAKHSAFNPNPRYRLQTAAFSTKEKAKNSAASQSPGTIVCRNAKGLFVTVAENAKTFDTASDVEAFKAEQLLNNVDIPSGSYPVRNIDCPV